MSSIAVRRPAESSVIDASDNARGRASQSIALKAGAGNGRAGQSNNITRRVAAVVMVMVMVVDDDRKTRPMSSAQQASPGDMVRAEMGRSGPGAPASRSRCGSSLVMQS